MSYVLLAAKIIFDGLSIERMRQFVVQSCLILLYLYINIIKNEGDRNVENTFSRR